jgi:hypothetical protein
MREPRYGLAALAGAAAGSGRLIGARLARSDQQYRAHAVQVVVVFGFVTINFTLVNVALRFLLSVPARGHRAGGQSLQAWANRQLPQIATVVALLAGDSW